MGRINIFVEIKDEAGKPVALEDMDVQMLKRLRYRFLSEAGRIAHMIFKRTGEILEK